MIPAHPGSDRIPSWGAWGGPLTPPPRAITCPPGGPRLTSA
jgi:hypothetical protein